MSVACRGSIYVIFSAYELHELGVNAALEEKDLVRNHAQRKYKLYPTRCDLPRES